MILKTFLPVLLILMSNTSTQEVRLPVKRIWRSFPPLCFEMQGVEIIARYDLNRERCV